jgi:hypothetical protein
MLGGSFFSELGTGTGALSDVDGVVSGAVGPASSPVGLTSLAALATDGSAWAAVTSDWGALEAWLQAPTKGMAESASPKLTFLKNRAFISLIV